jgi:hypothetical protein
MILRVKYTSHFFNRASGVKCQVGVPNRIHTHIGFFCGRWWCEMISSMHACKSMPRHIHSILQMYIITRSESWELENWWNVWMTYVLCCLISCPLLYNSRFQLPADSYNLIHSILTTYLCSIIIYYRRLCLSPLLSRKDAMWNMTLWLIPFTIVVV